MSASDEGLRWLERAKLAFSEKNYTTAARYASAAATCLQTENNYGIAWSQAKALQVKAVRYAYNPKPSIWRRLWWAVAGPYAVDYTMPSGEDTIDEIAKMQ